MSSNSILINVKEAAKAQAEPDEWVQKREAHLATFLDRKRKHHEEDRSDPKHRRWAPFGLRV